MTRRWTVYSQGMNGEIFIPRGSGRQLWKQDRGVAECPAITHGRDSPESRAGTSGCGETARCRKALWLGMVSSLNSSNEKRMS